MPDALLVLVYALAVARVTRLVNSDRITERPREWLLSAAWGRQLMPWAREAFPDRPVQMQRQHARAAGDRARADGGEPGLLAYLLTCPWCVSIYVGAVAAPLVWFWGSSPWLAIPAVALAFSQVTGLMAPKGD